MRIEDRFWKKVDRSGPIPIHRPDLGPCWIWTAGKHIAGYGWFRFGTRMVLAHRVSFAWANGSIDETLVLDHLCRVRACVNPDHLEMVTLAVNTARGAQAMKTHCPLGHSYDASNTYREVKGGRAVARHCRRCMTNRDARRSEMRRMKKVNRHA